ncbi:MAG: DUF11 domain-containing protein [Anaerolineae bacterium]|nr:DUF11 domain-containing protein [Anaerolineae bacterium]
MVKASGSRSFCLAREAVVAALLAFLMLTIPAGATPVQARPVGATAAEIASLTSLYNALGGPGWTNNSNWLGGDPCLDDWYGVTCDAMSNTDVIGVSLYSNNLVGDIGALDLAGLAHLGTLNLSYNQITGDIADLDLSSNIDFTRLNLNGNQIRGDIAAFDVSQNPRLFEVQLYGNRIGGNIADLNLDHNPSLWYFDLSENEIGGDVADLDITTNLSLAVLRLIGNQIGGDIANLDIDQNTALRRIDLNNNQIGGDIATLDLSYNLSLQALELGGNQIRGAIGALDITHNTALTTLNLEQNQLGGNIEDMNLTQNTVLEYLWLAQNQIGGDIAGLNLTQNSALFSLFLEENQIGGDAAYFSLANQANLVWLRLNDNQLYGTVPDLTSTHVDEPSMGDLRLCGGANVINSSGTPAIDTFAETYDHTGWTAANGCGNTTPLAVTAACNGADLAVTITAGDNPFNITGAGPGLPRNGVGIGTTTLAGPGSWTGLVVAETAGNLEQVRLGDIACTQQPVPITMPGGVNLTVLDPALSKSGSPLNAKIGEQVTYTIIVGNPHNQPINNVVVTDPIPSIFDVVDVATSRGTSSVSGQVVTVSIGTLQSGEQATITIIVQGNATAQPGRICNTAAAGNTRAEGCVTLMPTQLPATGGRPVQAVPLPWIATGVGVVVIGGLALRRIRVRRKDEVEIGDVLACNTKEKNEYV